MKTHNILLLLLSSLTIFYSVSADEYVQEDRITKLKACVKLSNKIIEDDASFIEEFVKANYPGFLKTTFDTMYVGLHDGILLNCFSHIGMIQAAPLTTASSAKVNPYTKDNKELMKIENFLRRYPNGSSEARYQKDLGVMNGIKGLLEFQEDGLALYETSVANALEYWTTPKNKVGSVHREKVTKKQNGQEDVKETKEEQRQGRSADLDLFGLKINSMSSGMKNLIGLGLLAVLFGGLYLAFKQITKKEEVKPKKVKKNKNKE